MRLPVTLVAAVAQGVRPACHAAMHVWHLRHLQKRHGSNSLSAELLEALELSAELVEESNLLSSDLSTPQEVLHPSERSVQFFFVIVAED